MLFLTLAAHSGLPATDGRLLRDSTHRLSVPATSAVVDSVRLDLLLDQNCRQVKAAHARFFHVLRLISFFLKEFLLLISLVPRFVVNLHPLSLSNCFNHFVNSSSPLSFSTCTFFFLRFHFSLIISFIISSIFFLHSRSSSFFSSSSFILIPASTKPSRRSSKSFVPPWSTTGARLPLRFRSNSETNALHHVTKRNCQRANRAETDQLKT